MRRKNMEIAKLRSYRNITHITFMVMFDMSYFLFNVISYYNTVYLWNF